MPKEVKSIPDGYHSVTPYLIIDGGRANDALDFYTRAFNAKVEISMPRPSGGIAHAEILLGDSRIMLADESPNVEAYGPKHYGGTPVTLHGGQAFVAGGHADDPLAGGERAHQAAHHH